MIRRFKPIQLNSNIKSTSMNQSYKEKKSGFPNRSETAPSAVGIDSIFAPLKKLVSMLLALSSKFICFAVFTSSVPVDDWHLHSIECVTIKPTTSISSNKNYKDSIRMKELLQTKIASLRIQVIISIKEINTWIEIFIA